MLGLVFNIAATASGLLLATSILDKWDGEKDYFKNIANFLLPYNTIIGGFIFGLGVLGIFNPGCFIHDVIAIAAGLLLITDILAKAPLIGGLLVKASIALVPFKVTVGIAILIVGITRLFGMGILC